MEATDPSTSESESIEKVVKPPVNTQDKSQTWWSRIKSKFNSIFGSLEPEHRLHISIRTQLIALVLFVALFSLFTLAVVTGVYFSAVLKQTRASKLEVAAQLKAAQMEQGFNYYYYQATLLSTKDSIQNVLAYRKAGNTSVPLLNEAYSSVMQFLETSTLFNSARLYDANFQSISNISLPQTNDSIFDPLYVLSEYDDPPDELLENGGLIWGPIKSQHDYFASFTMPINTNSTFLVQEKSLAGYLSIVMNVTVLLSASDSSSSTDGESVEFVKPVYPINDSKNITGFSYAFEPNSLISIDTVYPLNSYLPVNLMFANNRQIGHVLGVHNPLGEKVSVGYALVNLTYATWGTTLEQKESSFMQPISKLAKMMVGVCVGISALMCFITFMLAHYGVRPILRLQKAAEEITEGRGLRKSHGDSRRSPFKRHDKKSSKFRSKSSSRSSSPYSSDPSPGRLPPCNIVVTTGSGEATSTNVHESTLTHIENRSKERLVVPSEQHTALTSAAFGRKYNGEETPGYVTDTTSTDMEKRVATPLPSIVETHGLFYDELTELTEAFNAMTEELDKQYTHLEDRVRARTKELEVAKVQAEAANEAKTVFIANITHELRTPLNGILGMASVAMAEKDMKKIQSSLELIFRSGELLLHILTQLLTFSKNQLSKTKLQDDYFLLLEIASQTESIFRKTAKDQGVNLIIDITPDVARKMILYGDSNRITQIVMNLVSNSLKFTPRNGIVRVSVKVLGEYDEQRSKASHYDNVYVKGLRAPPESCPPYHPDALFARRAITSETSSVNSMSSARSTHTLDTLSSEDYNATIEKDVAEGERQYYDQDEDTFIGKKTPDPNLVRCYHESCKFKENVQHSWVIRFSVSDTGTGIDKSLQDKIFEAFVQGDQTFSRSHGGTGLGLSICKQFAKLMHGTLLLDSKAEKGSTFTFTVPLPQVGELTIKPDDVSEFYFDQFNAKSPHSKNVRFTKSTDSPSNEERKSRRGLIDPLENPFVKPELITRASTGTAHSRVTNSNKTSSSESNSDLESSPDEYKSKLRFLVAEDNLVNQEVVKRMMKLEGYTDVTLACDGCEAIDLIKESMENGTPFDMVLMDVWMPKMDGMAATKVIRNHLHYQNPIVALTAFADKSNEAECIDAGMSGFLSKPVRRTLLREVIEKFCGEATDSDINPFAD